MKKIYISSSLRKEVFDHVTHVLDNVIKSEEFIFRPRKGQLQEKKHFANVDAYAIRECDEVWLVGDYGRDCSWEIGYAHALGKVVKIFKDDTNAAKLEEDWMINADGHVHLIDLRDRNWRYGYQE